MVEFRFERLEVWQLSIAFVDTIYRMSKSFPSDERFGLTSQLRRAAVSIAANIAEGTGRISDRDNLRFVEIGYGSLMEVVSHAEVAFRQQFLNEAQREEIRIQADKIARQLSGWANHLRKQSNP